MRAVPAPDIKTFRYRCCCNSPLTVMPRQRGQMIEMRLKKNSRPHSHRRLEPEFRRNTKFAWAG